MNISLEEVGVVGRFEIVEVTEKTEITNTAPEDTGEREEIEELDPIPEQTPGVSTNYTIEEVPGKPDMSSKVTIGEFFTPIEIVDDTSLIDVEAEDANQKIYLVYDQETSKYKEYRVVDGKICTILSVVAP